ncbi:type VI secretion system ImpA family N-terminal domain-containing protein [Variovorax sp. ZS18.2.2]|uniref:type VI secretion system protein TssA n=1 Tax=Variovorax sp. ZS18.2.2 TaxID=2971255 RepID=UPI002151DE36|nr:type VI secretion system ImpA family N-terminal domain-containing protein [Variovorax sp. ZS18.2.2]MCR6475737.1 type VI secretion system ImpA family N-terminal domain-containing protein [Variovorax sp. ZS18.2.2]
MTYVDSPLVPAIELEPLNARAPCGPSLEYDAEYAVLLSRMSPRGDAQYGQFVGTPEAPNWAEIERDCRRLLLRTRDINLFVWLCRARTRLAQAAGLAQSLAVLSEVLERWPDAVHPQLVVEGERDPAVRANALAALADPDGLLGDVREIVVAANAARHLTVREIERAWSVPRLADAPSPESVAQQLTQLRLAANGDADAPVNLLSQALRASRQIADWAARQLSGDAPSLQALIDLLKPFDEIDAIHRAEPVSSREGTERPSVSGPAPRDDVLRAIRSAREWFENHEPSSPVAVLLKQAERMVGQRFALVANAIPLDLLQKWDSEGERV